MNRINAFLDSNIQPTSPKSKSKSSSSIWLSPSANNEQSLGSLGVLPMDMILLFLSQLAVKDLLNTSLVNKTFYQITQTPQLWKNLVNRHHPNFIPIQPVLNWKETFKDLQDENFLLFRKRTCSAISDIVPHGITLRRARAFRALTSSPVVHYFSFNEKGRLQAIFFERVRKVYNVDGKIQKISEREWNVKAAINRQFIFLSFFDARHPFSPSIELNPIGNLNLRQQMAVQKLQKNINRWFAQTIKAPDLEEQVKEALKGHYNPNFKTISCVNEEPDAIKAEHKAYFIFFRALMENPSFEENPKYHKPTKLFNPKKV